MRLISSYSVKLSGHSYLSLNQTFKIYNKAVKYLVNVCFTEFECIKDLDLKSAQMIIDSVVHTTKSHDAKYNFDSKFYKFPSMYRRTAISNAISIVKSHMELVDLWNQNGCIGKKPKLNRNNNTSPCLYRKDLYKELENNCCQIKLLKHNDWVWIDFKLNNLDMNYITKNCSDLKLSAPVLQKKNKKINLRFSVERTVSLPKNNDVVCGVDLGLNTDATCSVLHKNGTVTARRFINSAVEKDRLYKLLGKIKKSQKHGNFKNQKLWRFVNNYNKAIAMATASKIVKFAYENNVDVIVMEHLNFTGKKKGSKKQRLALWRKREILERVTDLAHRFGIRVSTVNPYNTSRLAFDGSGKVERNIDGNYSICRFSNGKIYNCDLSASYNIGSRFFIREILKSFSEREKHIALVKIPELYKRTQNTLSTLISLNVVMAKKHFVYN